MSELQQSNVTNCDEEFGKLKRKLGDDDDVCLQEISESRSEQSKQQKRGRSSELHNLNERLRRQRLKEKIKALQDLIPNCSMAMSMGAGYTPQTMMPHPQQQGLQIPPGIEINYGIGIETGMGMGMGTSTIFPSLYFPASQMGILPNNSLLPSSVVSGMPSNFTCPVSIMESHGSKSMTASSQGPIQSSTRRVLPSRIVQPHPSNEVMDYGCSHSGSNEGSSSFNPSSAF